MFKRDVPSGFPAESRLIHVTNYGVVLSIVVALSGICPAAQTPRPTPRPTQSPKASPQSASAWADASGMYSFEREGEFVQITIEQAGPRHEMSKPLAVTGYISRYADTESDRGAFLDYFFAKGSLDGDKITFTTKQVHGNFYEFSGTVARGVALTRDKDGYYELRGTLTQNIVGPDKTVPGKTREIAMKLFPDIDHDAPKK